MKMGIRNNQDFWCGLMFMVVGAVAIVAAWDYPFGTTLRMGPGYFPVMLSGIMILFGLIILLKGLRQSEKIQGNWSIRALIILPISLALFGILMEVAGFIPALIALIFISAASGSEFKLKEVLVLTAILVAIAWTVFIWGLGLPYPMFQKFW
jgi:hypothetical protein